MLQPTAILVRFEQDIARVSVIRKLETAGDITLNSQLVYTSNLEVQQGSAKIRGRNQKVNVK